VGQWELVGSRLTWLPEWQTTSKFILMPCDAKWHSSAMIVDKCHIREKNHKRNEKRWCPNSGGNVCLFPEKTWLFLPLLSFPHPSFLLTLTSQPQGLTSW
jgi:hypothetical protein